MRPTGTWRQARPRSAKAPAQPPSVRASCTVSTATRAACSWWPAIPAAHVALQAQLKARRVRKTYLGLVGGVVNAQLGRIEKPIGRDPRTRLRMAVTADGRPAVTGYRVRERFGEWTLLELDLVTGRTHQIRVHLASIGHAVAGDPVYATGATRRGPDGLTRLFLHAWKLEFVSPGSGRLVRCEAPLPDDLEGALESLRAAASGRA